VRVLVQRFSMANFSYFWGANFMSVVRLSQPPACMSLITCKVFSWVGFSPFHMGERISSDAQPRKAGGTFKSKVLEPRECVLRGL
jgi:hypothetical protein